ncbi:MAG: hypothetical protein IKX20_08060 [Paludibacteraceae bacterium]|nr:hypothetical protein [Paludibacteraceae bacterium]
MTKAVKYIVFLSALFLAACGTVSTAPLDDTYYWPDGQETTAQTDTTPNVQ